MTPPFFDALAELRSQFADLLSVLFRAIRPHRLHVDWVFRIALRRAYPVALAGMRTPSR